MSLIQPKPRIRATVMHIAQRDQEEGHRYELEITVPPPGATVELWARPSPQSGFTGIRFRVEDLRELLEEVKPHE